MIQPKHWLRREGEWDNATGPQFDEYDSSVLSELALVCGEKLILPRLEGFHVRMALEDCKFRDILPSFFPASLKSLCIEADLNERNKTELLQFLQVLEPSCQTIHHLRVASSFDYDAVTDNPLGLTDLPPMQELYRLPHLKSFGSYWGLLSGAQFMVPEKILNIAPCCNVTTLDLKFCNALSNVLKGYSGPFFPQLEHLTLQADGLQGAKEFLRCLSSRSLKGLHLDNYYDSGQDFPDFVVAAQQYLNPETLLHFDVQSRLGITPPSGPTKLSPQSLLPLFAFKNLESLVILLNQDLGLLDDAHFGQICDAFPRLRILDIAGLEHAMSVSTMGAMSALQRLPSLEFFGLRVPIDLPLDDAAAYRFPQLATLATRSSPLVDVAMTADFIRSFFPSLKFIVLGAKPVVYDFFDNSMDEEVGTENAATADDLDPHGAVSEHEYLQDTFTAWVQVVRHMQSLECRYKVVAKETVKVHHPPRFGEFDPLILPL